MSSNIAFEIQIAFDNRCYNKGFLPGFGFSALIHSHFTNNYFLFDTGGDGDVLLHNLQQFGVEISDINKVIISHSHLDHAGGLREIYNRNPNIAIYVPIGDESAFKGTYNKANVYGISDSKLIEENVYSSGQLDRSHLEEQALFLRTKDNEIIILVGCSHPGLESFILKAKEIADVRAIIGGFHGFRKFSYLEDIEVIAACHCTQYMAQIQKRFPEQFKKVCVGDKLTF
jgi:7,8-dihydropterin-6-yl-methyl-4-(beta-D-ribofuranosyl)aminobenzene 5'-phosphate synthase